MELTTNDRFLSLLIKAVRHSLVPELHSQGACATADIVCQVLEEMKKRGNFTSSLLASHIEEGNEIVSAMTVLLGSIVAEPVNESVGLGVDFSILASRYDNLTKKLARLAGMLCESCDERSPGEQLAHQEILRRAADWEYRYYVKQHGEPSGYTEDGDEPVSEVGNLTPELLEHFIRRQSSQLANCSISRFEIAPGGYSKETFRFTLKEAGSQQSLIVRKNTPVPIINYGGFRIDREFHLLRDLGNLGLPVAKPLYLGADVPGVNGDFYVMTMLPGKPPGNFLAGAESLPDRLLLHMAELLAKIHSVKTSSLSGFLARYYPEGAPATVSDAYRSQISAAMDYYNKEEHLASPYIVFLFDWLTRNIPESSKSPVIVHGDFSIHNMLAEDEVVTGILDWECSDFGTPEQDLSYIKPHVSRHIDWRLFLNHYRNSGGPEIDERLMGFCTAFSCMRTSLATNKGLLNVQRGMENDIRFVMSERFSAEFMGRGLAATLLDERIA
jgi:aminoglycoside phosphotransferase (APT) family kinase protein